MEYCVKLVFTKGDSWFSKSIMWMLNEPCSHFAIEFENDPIVFHSNLLGCHISSKTSFYKKSKKVFELKFNLTLDEEEKIYQRLVSDFEGQAYDFGAFFYFTYRAFLFKFFGASLPVINPFQNKKTFLCTGLAASLPLSICPRVDFEMISPFHLYNMIKDFILLKKVDKK